MADYAKKGKTFSHKGPMGQARKKAAEEMIKAAGEEHDAQFGAEKAIALAGPIAGTVIGGIFGGPAGAAAGGKIGGVVGDVACLVSSLWLFRPCFSRLFSYVFLLVVVSACSFSVGSALCEEK